MNKQIPYALLALAVLVAPACSEKKQLDDMHDSTLEMRETTVNMGQKMFNR